MKNLLLLILVFVVSCKGQKNMITSKGSIVLLLEDNYSGLTKKENIIIKDQKSLKSFFSKINKTRKPGIPVPNVDFKKETLVVVCSGEHKNTLNSSLELTLETDEEIQLKTIYNKEKKKEKAIVSPFKIYKIPVSDKEITFKK
ncbi:hypothetical protein [uncultured Maribacter sp.]|uniref:hypothetical protein n=1 Tax=uncultured Maribacter sp. TaxID=431308 RepID=UPI00260D382B|nr:hypothetical protein [uncultured Maribacter sp.]